MADNIWHFQDGRMAAMRGDKRDGRRHKDWLEGYDQTYQAKVASYVPAEPEGK